MRPLLRAAIALLLAAASSACSSTGARWDGRRGYDGNGDYGYDLAASKAEARAYRAHAASSYPAPGTPGDPWGPYVREAALRFRIPERWIRAVMRQESGGRLIGSDGALVTSPVGAMGLMQVMPQTYAILQQHYRLGSDPYEPHDNIMAGAAYIREMYDRFGSPGFLAAYNAGPDRLNAYLTNGDPLPNETVGYLSSVAPALGTEVAMSGPLAVFAGPAGMQAPVRTAMLTTAEDDPSMRAFDGGGLVTADAPTGRLAAATAPVRPAAGGGWQGGNDPPSYGTGWQDASRTGPAGWQPASGTNATGWQDASAANAAGWQAPRAPETPSNPGNRLGWLGPAGAPGSPVPAGNQATEPAWAPGEAAATGWQPPRNGDRWPVQSTAIRPVSMPVPAPSDRTWAIQVGAFPDPVQSRAAISLAKARLGTLLASAHPAITAVQSAGVLYRARLLGLSPATAAAACAELKQAGIACFTVPPSY